MQQNVLGSNETLHCLLSMPNSSLNGWRPGCVGCNRWQTASVGPSLSMLRHVMVWHNLLSHKCESAPKSNKLSNKNNKDLFSILGKGSSSSVQKKAKNFLVKKEMSVYRSFLWQDAILCKMCFVRQRGCSVSFFRAKQLFRHVFCFQL